MILTDELFQRFQDLYTRFLSHRAAAVQARADNSDAQAVLKAAQVNADNALAAFEQAEGVVATDIANFGALIDEIEG